MLKLVPMTQTEFLAYAEEAIPAYAADKVASGQWAQEESMDLSRKALEELLPQGLGTPDNQLFTIQDAEAGTVGMLWFNIQLRAGRRIAYVYDVNLRPEHRRKGFATGAFHALEERGRSLGLSGIALHVFGHNTAAQALYAKLGFRTTNINMFKNVD